MTKKLRGEIYDIIRNQINIAPEIIKKLTNEISVAVDKEVGKAIIEGLTMGEICEAVGLELVGKDSTF